MNSGERTVLPFLSEQPRRGSGGGPSGILVIRGAAVLLRRKRVPNGLNADQAIAKDEGVDAVIRLDCL
jgi:hypothetical protein